MQSAPTARRRIIPLITICIYELMFIRTIPLLNTPIIRTPAMTFDIFPDPPFTLTPPSTTHVITSNSYPTPAFGCAVLARASITKPAIPAKSPDREYTRHFTTFILIPERSAASSFPPSA